MLQLVYLPVAAILLDTREFIRLAGTVGQTSQLWLSCLLNYSELRCHKENLALCCTKETFVESQFSVPPVISVGYCYSLTVPDTPLSCQSRNPPSRVLKVADIHSGQLYHSRQLTGIL